MEYEHLHEEDVERVDLTDNDDIPVAHDMKPIGDALGLDNVRARVWYIEPGDQIGYHAHEQQEELFYLAEGTLSLKVGRSGETETVEAEAGTWWAAGPKVGHGHRNVGEETCVVFAFGAPSVDDVGLDPHELADR